MNTTRALCRSVALEQLQGERRRRLALLEWQHEAVVQSAGRLYNPATEVAPPDAGWALRHRRMHLLQVDVCDGSICTTLPRLLMALPAAHAVSASVPEQQDSSVGLPSSCCTRRIASLTGSFRECWGTWPSLGLAIVL